MVYILIEASCDGDYIPDNSLQVSRVQTYAEVEDKICKSIQYFLGQNCLTNPNSNELQMTDFTWNNPWNNPFDVEEPKHVESLDSFMSKVKAIVASMPTDELKPLTKPKSKQAFRVYADDDEFIELLWTTDSLRIQYNMAPNRNKWSHVDYKIITAE